MALLQFAPMPLQARSDDPPAPLGSRPYSGLPELDSGVRRQTRDTWNTSTPPRYRDPGHPCLNATTNRLLRVQGTKTNSSVEPQTDTHAIFAAFNDFLPRDVTSCRFDACHVLSPTLAYISSRGSTSSDVERRDARSNGMVSHDIT